MTGKCTHMQCAEKCKLKYVNIGFPVVKYITTSVRDVC